MGDYKATLFSMHSHNRKFGHAFVEGELAEGVSTVKAIRELSMQNHEEVPI
jgi:glycerol-3-phosphate dehydrogenase (NAD(P)+)